QSAHLNGRSQPSVGLSVCYPQDPHARRHRTTRDGTAGRAVEGRDPGRPGAGRDLRPDQEINQPAEPRTVEPPSARGTLQDAHGRLRPLQGERVSLPQRAVLRTDNHDRVVLWNIPFRGDMQRTPTW